MRLLRTWPSASCGAALALALAAGPARAVLIDSGDGSENTGAPADDPGFANLGIAISASLTAIYLGDGWVLSAHHVGLSDVAFGGVTYTAVPGSYTVLQHGGGWYADMAMWQVSPAPPLPSLALRSTPPAVSAEALLIGKGQDRGAATTWRGVGGYEVQVLGHMRWGTNRISSAGGDFEIAGHLTHSMIFDFTSPPPGLQTDQRCDAIHRTAQGQCPESQGRPGDSGGAVFLRNAAGQWELAGVLYAIATFMDQPTNLAIYGNETYASDLSYYRSQIEAIMAPPPCSTGPDSDGDGVVDSCDDCTLVPNPSQGDADGDLYGNACDGDFDQSGIVSAGDFKTFRLCAGKTVGPGVGPAEDPTCAESDMDGSGNVVVSDFVLWVDTYGKAPGPSGLAP